MTEAEIDARIRSEIDAMMAKGDGLAGVVAIAVSAYFKARRLEVKAEQGKTRWP